MLQLRTILRGLDGSGSMLQKIQARCYQQLRRPVEFVSTTAFMTGDGREVFQKIFRRVRVEEYCKTIILCARSPLEGCWLLLDVKKIVANVDFDGCLPHKVQPSLR